jgi:hypothetical protein
MEGEGDNEESRNVNEEGIGCGQDGRIFVEPTTTRRRRWTCVTVEMETKRETEEDKTAADCRRRIG